MNVVTYALGHIDLFLVILARLISFMVTAPLLSQRVFPAWTKIGLAGVIALLTEPGLSLPGGAVPSLMQVAVWVAGEVVVGLLLGWIASLLYAAIAIGGRFLDVEIGLNVAPVLYGTDGFSASILEGFQTTLFALYFVGMNGLDGLVLAILDSYRFIPIGHFALSAGALQLVTGLFEMMFVLAVQFVIPIICTMLLVQTTMAVLARAVPSMNVLFVGLPAQIWAGLAMMAVGMAAATYVFGQVFNDLFHAMSQFLQG